MGEAASAAHALEFLQVNRPILVVTDISMPGMNGIDLTREIRARFPDVEVIVVSGMDERTYVRAALEAGAVVFVPKFELSKSLAPAIRKAARRRARHGGAA